MRISDWSSDVCSSDLKELAGEFGLADRDIGNDLKLFSRQIDVAVGKSGSCASLTIAQAATNAFAVDRALVEFIAEPIEIIGAASSEESRVGQECVRTCRSRLSHEH